MLTLDAATTTTIARPGVVLVRLHDNLWRVTRSLGDVLGYVERFSVPDGFRFRAKRFVVRQRRFLVDGEFWNMEDAVGCFRFS